MSGPFEAEREARNAALEAGGPPRPGGSILSAAQNRQLLMGACEIAGISLGAYDRRILDWFAGFEDAACAVIAGLIGRACQAGASRALRASGPGDNGAPALDENSLRLVLDALDVAADHKRDVAANCGDCEIRPEGLCPDCETRLERADEYGRLAERLQGGGPMRAADRNGHAPGAALAGRHGSQEAAP